MFDDLSNKELLYRYVRAKWELVSDTTISTAKQALKIVSSIHFYSVVTLVVANMLIPVRMSDVYWSMANMVGGVITMVFNPATGGGDQPFIPLHEYFISTTGSNANNCLTPATACADVSASGLSGVVCGDVILVNSGTYTGPIINQNAPSPSACPSAGGIYFVVLLCAGPDVMSCKVNTSSSGGSAFWVNRSNWAVSGFFATTKPDASNCFIGNNANTGGTAQHHVAFLNSIASTCGDSGFSTSGGGSATGSFDQAAIVGVAAYNAANSNNNGAECGSAISIIPANGSDTSVGTHIYIAGAFLGHNTNTGTPGSPGCNVAGGHSDGEAIILDTWGAAYTTAGYLYQAVIEQVVTWNSGGSSLQIFPQTSTSANDKAQYFIFGNTMYAGDQDATGNGICEADFHLHGISPNSGGTTSSIYDIENNLVLATFNTCGNLGVNPSFAMDIFPEDSALLAGGPITIQNNYFWNSAAPTSNVYNTTNNNVAYLDTTSANGCNNGASRCTTFVFGTNNYSNPGLANPTALWSTAPDCTGYILVTTCMLNKYNVYTNVVPTIASITLGYQPPGPCTTRILSNSTNAYPSWLKGINTLVASGFVTGAIITEKAGAITKPCGV